MKRTIRLIAAIVFSALLQSCNGTAFIDEFLKGNPVLELSPGDTGEVAFENEDWSILKIRTAGEDGAYISGKIYDLDGNPIYTSDISNADGLVQFLHSRAGLTFSVIRPTYDRLVIHLAECVLATPEDIEVVVGNRWAQKRIRASLNSGQKRNLGKNWNKRKEASHE